MCYFNGVKVSDKAELIRLKQIEKFIAQNRDILNCSLNEGPLYNQPYPVIKANEEGTIDIVRMEWGLIPNQNKWPFLRTREQVTKWRMGYTDEKGYNRPITTLNAVADTLFINEKGKVSMYADAAQNGRCLVPSTGFWEWRHFKQIGKSGKDLKTPIAFPYHVVVKGKIDEPYYLAGIYNEWTDETTGEVFETFSIPTTGGNELMNWVHNKKRRMPTILTEDEAFEWLYGKLGKDDIIDLARRQFPAGQMDAWAVDKKFKEVPDPRAKANYDFLPEIGDDRPLTYEEVQMLESGPGQGTLF